MSEYRFGMECEVSRGAGDMLTILYDGGNVSDTHLHEYHCGCSDCAPDRDGPDWAGQEDCTADGEFVSRILTTGDEGDRALAILSDALIRGRAEQSDRVGIHVHVDAEPFADDPAAKVRLWRLWANYQDDVGILARGSASRVRDYNSPNIPRHGEMTGLLGWESRVTVDQFFSLPHAEVWQSMDRFVTGGSRTGRWLSGGRRTFEFRLWNGTRSLWRLRMAVYVSVAFARAALDGHDAHPDDGLCLLDAIGAHLPDDVWFSVWRQLHLHDIDA